MSDDIYAWNDNGEDVAVAECSQCGETRPCRFVPDPFIAEVYPEDKPEPRWWCGTCFSNRKAEV